MKPIVRFPDGMGVHRAQRARDSCRWDGLSLGTGLTVRALGLQHLCCCPVCSHDGQVLLLSQDWDLRSLSPTPGSCSVPDPARISQSQTSQRCDHVCLTLNLMPFVCLRQKEK